jgi:hypothetical protein
MVKLAGIATVAGRDEPCAVAKTQCRSGAAVPVHWTPAKRYARMIFDQMPKKLLWLVTVTLAALLLYLTFRAYLGPEFLIGFANLFVC